MSRIRYDGFQAASTVPARIAARTRSVTSTCSYASSDTIIRNFSTNAMAS
jgi:hypothetical protein